MPHTAAYEENPDGPESSRPFCRICEQDCPAEDLIKVRDLGRNEEKFIWACEDCAQGAVIPEDADEAKLFLTDVLLYAFRSGWGVVTDVGKPSLLTLLTHPSPDEETATERSAA